MSKSSDEINPSEPVPLASPLIGEQERALIDEVLASGQLSRGPMVQRFEEAFAAFVGAPHAVALSSGSAALHLGIRALELPPGAAIVTSPFSVPATANMVLAAGMQLQLCDISPTHLGLDPPQVACTITDETAAVLPVHVFGQSAEIEALADVCRIEGIRLIEDACEALGTRVNDQALGTFGDLGCFGFYPNKQITTGEGGMLVTGSAELAQRVRLMRNHGRSMDGSWHDQQLVGLNYRLPDLSAALGLGQLLRIDQVMQQRAELAAAYQRLLGGVSGLRPVAPTDKEICWFAWVVILDPRLPRDRIMADLKDRGIQTGRYFAPLHQQPALAPLVGDQGPFPVAEAMAARALALPFFNGMTMRQVERVCGELAALVEQYG